MSKFGVKKTQSGLLVAGTSLGFGAGEIMDLPDKAVEPEPLDAVSYTEVPLSDKYGGMEKQPEHRSAWERD